MREIKSLYFKWWVTVKMERYNALFTAYSYPRKTTSLGESLAESI